MRQDPLTDRYLESREPLQPELGTALALADVRKLRRPLESHGEKNMYPTISLSAEKKDAQDDNQRHARYANYFKVGHNAFEFLLDFGQSYGQSGEAAPHTRIVTTPVYAKTFAQTLQEAIARYEQVFGAIPDGDN